VKSYRVVLKRARKLRLRYAKKHVMASQERRHRNCRYNFEHAPIGLGRNPDVVELSVAPREVTTLLVLREDVKVHLCMYGSDDPENWPGDLCDRDDMADRCKWFEPLKSAKEAREEFDGFLKDDEWVYNNHRDLAVLQWVLDDRGTQTPRGFLSRWERFLLWLYVLLCRVKKPSPPQLMEGISEEDLRHGKCDEDLVGIWDDDSSEDSGTRSASGS